MSHQGGDREVGAVTLLVATCLLLLIAMAALAVDLSAGWTERRHDQTTADLAAVGGALSFVSADVQTSAVSNALTIAADNLGTTVTDPAFIASWESCTDPARPVGFSPMPAPSGWSVSTIDCISASPEELRIRLPDQTITTSFARSFGATTLHTSAVAHAKVNFSGGGGIRPFGILNGITAGITCLTTSPGGKAVAPCDGPASGNFGTLNSQTWGSRTTTTDCGTPNNDELGLAIATGVDHFIGLMPSFPGSGGPYGSFPSTTSRLDDCMVVSGTAVATDTTPASGPVNTMRADTGFNLFQATKNGLLTGEDGFPNSTVTVTPVLQQTGSGVLSTRLLSEKIGPTTYSYRVENTPLWMHLEDWSTLAARGVPAGWQPVCDKTVIAAAANPSTAMSQCLATYEAGLVSQPNLPPLFKETLGKNPRFGFVPQFHFTTWGSGNHWQPVLRYRMIYVDTIWFNCNGQFNSAINDEGCDGAKGLVFRPAGPSDETDMKVGNGANMKQLRLDQITAYLLPNQAVSKKTAALYPGGMRGPFEITLSR